MRIGIDISPLQTGARTRGIGTYIEALVQGLAAVESKHHYVLLSLRGLPPPFQALPSRFTFAPIIPCFPTRASAILSHQIALPLLMARLGVDVAHYTSIAAVPSVITAPTWSPIHSVVTLHDLTPLVLPHLLLTNVRYRFFYRYALLALRSAKAIACISQYTAEDAIRLLEISPSKLFVTPLALPTRFHIAQQEDAELPPQVQSYHPYILHVGGTHPNKNLLNVLRALYLLRQHDLVLHLVTVGGTSIDIAALEQQVPGVGAWHLHLENLLPGELNAVYRGAIALTFPSFYEGFGLPVLEAMCLGVPVVTSTNSSLPEVAGDAAVFVDPYDPTAIAAAIRRIAQQPTVAADLRARGFQQAARFTLERLGQATIRAYEATT